MTEYCSEKSVSCCNPDKNRGLTFLLKNIQELLSMSKKRCERRV